jgi:aminoglycoside phosphotransferase (APT) family kinase protein
VRPRTKTIREGTNLVYRKQLGDRWVYVKQYLKDNWDATDEVISQRLAIEIRTIERLNQLADWPQRLGRLHLANADIERGIIVTDEVHGISLDAWIHKYRSSQYRTGLILCYLAGAWLRHFQQLEIEPGDLIPIGDKNPTDLRQYLRIRITALLGHGYKNIRGDQWNTIMSRIDALDAEVKGDDRRLVLCHNDFSPANIISDGHCVTPIDFQMAAPGNPLLDVTYFLHRLELARLFRPWLIRPWNQWRRSLIRGYGRVDLEESPLYRLLQIRLLILRLLTYTKRKPANLKQALHNRWVLAAIRYKLLREIKS